MIRQAVTAASIVSGVIGLTIGSAQAGTCSSAIAQFEQAMRDSAKDITLPGALILRFSPGGRCEELREYWHDEEGRIEPPDGWGR